MADTGLRKNSNSLITPNPYLKLSNFFAQLGNLLGHFAQLTIQLRQTLFIKVSRFIKIMSMRTLDFWHDNIIMTNQFRSQKVTTEQQFDYQADFFSQRPRYNNIYVLPTHRYRVQISFTQQMYLI